MADDADRAGEREEIFRAVALAVRKPTGPRATGACLWCGEPVEDERRWCPGVECRDKWEAKAKQVVGAS